MASPADPFDRRNLLTYVSLFCGVGAVAAASAGAPDAAAALGWSAGAPDAAAAVGWPAGRAGTAGLAIAVAVIADTFDGRFARRFGSDPRRNALGTELDSLSDAIAFGIAPPLCSVLLLNAGLSPVGLALWVAVFVHAACAVTRLASYNVGTTEDAQSGFVGIPVPLAALIWSTALLVQPSAAVTLGVILVTAAAMVLPIRIPRPTGAGLVVFVLWPLAVGLCHLAFAIRH